MNIRIEQIQMLGNRILIKPDLAKTLDIVTAGGLVAASGKSLESNGQGGQQLQDIDIPTGKVIACGPDCQTLSPGDRVLFSPFSGKVLTFMMENYLLMSEPEPVMKIND